MKRCVFQIAVLGAFVMVVPAALAQPLLRQGESEDQPPTELDDEELERRAQARRKAQLEDESLMQQQQELMRLQGERLAAERDQIERDRKMMNYALAIAILVVATTLLIAFARSRISADSQPPSTPPPA